MNGLEEAVQVEEEGDESTDRQRVVEDHGATDSEQQGLTEDPDGLGAGAIDGVDGSGGDIGVAVLADHIAVVNGVVCSAVVGGDDAHPVE